MIGFDGYVKQLLDELSGYFFGMRILPIVGMAGVGKTTLARNVYENLFAVEHFDVRAWVTVSQTFTVRSIFQQALSCLGSEKYTSDHQLGERLRKILYGRRYLIVLDDVWSVEAWEKIKFYFPENYNRSRTVVTTRQQQLANYFTSSVAAMDLLDDRESWDLFCHKTFVGGDECCPPELVLESTVWMRPCFLYLGLFPEDHQTEVSKFIKFSVAEGFIKPNQNHSLEEVAESYIKELVDMNLVLVSKLRRNKRIETCYLHDLVRELCIRIAEKENFYRVQRDIAGTRHFIVDERSARSYPRESSESPSLYHPLELEGERVKPSSFNSRLLRVMHRPVNPDCQEVNLRLSIYSNPNFRYNFLKPPRLSPSISKFWSLQTLLYKDVSLVVPSEIWNMPQLRHFEMQSIRLPDPPPGDVVVLHNLQTLGRVKNLVLSDEICKRIPNIKVSGMDYYFKEEDTASWCFNLQNVWRLNKLELLRYSCIGKEHIVYPLQDLKLPNSLKELNLCDCRLAWTDLAIVGSLPHLHTLLLWWKAVVGAEWDYVEEKFLCLKYLQIQNLDDLIHWNADSSSFPALSCEFRKTG